LTGTNHKGLKKPRARSRVVFKEGGKGGGQKMLGEKSIFRYGGFEGNKRQSNLKRKKGQKGQKRKRLDGGRKVKSVLF